MPDVHIWIRKEDEAKWKAIANKPEWLHEHLNSEQAVIDLLKQDIEQAKDDMADEFIRTGKITNATALEDIKAGQSGGVYLHPNVVDMDEPTITPPEDAL